MRNTFCSIFLLFGFEFRKANLEIVKVQVINIKFELNISRKEDVLFFKRNIKDKSMYSVLVTQPCKFRKTTYTLQNQNLTCMCLESCFNEYQTLYSQQTLPCLSVCQMLLKPIFYPLMSSCFSVVNQSNGATSHTHYPILCVQIARQYTET